MTDDLEGESQQMPVTEEPATDGGLVEKGMRMQDSTPTETLESTADGVSAFNSVLWEIAKTFGIITVMLLFLFFLFMAWQIAQWGMATL